jgi:hypothetical protein
VLLDQPSMSARSSNPFAISAFFDVILTNCPSMALYKAMDNGTNVIAGLSGNLLSRNPRSFRILLAETSISRCSRCSRRTRVCLCACVSPEATESKRITFQASLQKNLSWSVGKGCDSSLGGNKSSGMSSISGNPQVLPLRNLRLDSRG